MIGMALGMLLARVTMGHALAIWFCFLSLTMFHMYGKFFYIIASWNILFDHGTWLAPSLSLYE
jgi:hypothetical protein